MSYSISRWNGVKWGVLTNGDSAFDVIAKFTEKHGKEDGSFILEKTEQVAEDAGYGNIVFVIKGKTIRAWNVVQGMVIEMEYERQY